MDSRNFAIGILSTTAIILLVGIVIISTQPEPVWADGMTATGGGYVLTVGDVEAADEELLYVVDGSTEKLIAYRFNPARRQIEIVQGLDLAELRRPPGQPARPRRGQP